MGHVSEHALCRTLDLIFMAILTFKFTIVNKLRVVNLEQSDDVNRRLKSSRLPGDISHRGSLFVS